MKPRADVPKRPLTRGEPVLRAVLEATLQELARVGPNALSVEAVADLAKVNKTTIYRRFVTKWELVGAALMHARTELHTPDTGSLRDDLVAIVLEASRFLTSPLGRGVFNSVISETPNAEIVEIVKRLRRTEEDPALKVLRRGLARGELSPEVDLHLLLSALVGPVIHHVLLEREQLRPEDAAAMVDLLLGGAAARPFESGSKRAPSRAAK